MTVEIILKYGQQQSEWKSRRVPETSFFPLASPGCEARLQRGRPQGIFEAHVGAAAGGRKSWARLRACLGHALIFSGSLRPQGSFRKPPTDNERLHRRHRAAVRRHCAQVARPGVAEGVLPIPSCRSRLFSPRLCKVAARCRFRDSLGKEANEPPCLEPAPSARHRAPRLRGGDSAAGSQHYSPALRERLPEKGDRGIRDRQSGWRGFHFPERDYWLADLLQAAGIVVCG